MPRQKETQRGARRMRGFERTSRVLDQRIRAASESRGFAVSRLLTQWAEIVGAEIAGTAKPVEVRYGRQGLGATLTLLTTGAAAPVVEMQKERIREKVNACYGYAAISRIRLTQTAAAGFAEERAAFAPAPSPPAPAPETAGKADALSGGVADDDLRAALRALGQNVLSRRHRQKGPP